ncbi:MAG: hypothetical protein A3C88_02295 [Candidatus Yanofskybacteria bacterium RIFCSPHIGHO2_02_FULL_50_12]|uniref:Uncharacterized protein n=1 Tax=Candidatus Yanofskybacteria bacterium RIFCSPHIGHO2_02_FULL_50_12 TaxID=1802685 RepID=A0A1F8FW36_9BACT|nr:MAG: hypothetical protein A3C88_02295 [Candidatus Yanofskybacteria bacterium RIFCSPHIGHO2_02_FULL_50_12]
MVYDDYAYDRRPRPEKVVGYTPPPILDDDKLASWGKRGLRVRARRSLSEASEKIETLARRAWYFPEDAMDDMGPAGLFLVCTALIVLVALVTAYTYPSPSIPPR